MDGPGAGLYRMHLFFPTDLGRFQAIDYPILRDSANHSEPVCSFISDLLFLDGRYQLSEAKIERNPKEPDSLFRKTVGELSPDLGVLILNCLY